MDKEMKSLFDAMVGENFPNPEIMKNRMQTLIYRISADDVLKKFHLLSSMKWNVVEQTTSIHTKYLTNFYYTLEGFVIVPVGIGHIDEVQGFHIFAINDINEKLEVYGLLRVDKTKNVEKFIFGWIHDGPWKKEFNHLKSRLIEEIHQADKELIKIKEKRKQDEIDKIIQEKESEKFNFMKNYRKGM